MAQDCWFPGNAIAVLELRSLLIYFDERLSRYIQVHLGIDPPGEGPLITILQA